ncbi:MAG TPA: GlsB/YeaQ/YmgE family stress response membrane protein [Candidatus Binatia bacterium]|jgi:uncharacterized membrane protein YeaQ/YmgE (transglycosylase-associated protein family)
MFHVIWSVLVGFVVGLMARLLMPGADSMGFLATSIVGILGSVVGGFLGTVLKKPEPGSNFHPAGFVLSVVGAIVLLWALRMAH